MSSTTIWQQRAWNPITGCTKISDACTECYAQKVAIRQWRAGHKMYRNGFRLTLHPEVLKQPLSWTTPEVIFVCSSSDLFHKKVPDSFILEVFQIMNTATWHIFQILTKRSDRLLKLAPQIDWSENIWVGVTIESQKYLFRKNHLAQISAAVKFLSFEPLLSGIPNIDLRDTDWVIASGEIGKKRRKTKIEWLQCLREQCLAADVPFFFAEWGGETKKGNSRLLDGREWNELPNVAAHYGLVDYYPIWFEDITKPIRVESSTNNSLMLPLNSTT